MKLSKEWVEHMPDLAQCVKDGGIITKGPDCECGCSEVMEHEHCGGCGKLLCKRHSRKSITLGRIKLRLVLFLILILAAPLAHADGIKAPQFTLSLTFVGLSAADTGITIYGCKHLPVVEMNGFMRPFLENHRYFALWCVQAAGCAVILTACHALIHNGSKVGRIAGYALLVAVNVGRAYLVIHNLSLHSQIRRTA